MTLWNERVGKSFYFFFYISILILGCRQAPKLEETPPPPYHFITNQDLLSVTSPDPEHVWIAGFNSLILHSNDGGINWVYQKSPILTDLCSIFFVNNKNGWAVGNKGTIIHTVDGGNRWFDKSENVAIDGLLMDIHFVDSKVGWIVGEYGTILHTEDEGNTWEKQGWDEDRIYNDVFFLDNQTGWIVGEYGTIYHTIDGGKNWEKQACKELVPTVSKKEHEPPAASLYGVYFTNADKGWAVGLDGAIISTEDGGKNWTKLKSPVDLTIFKVIMMADKGWAVGLRGNYVISTDKGNSWVLNEKALKTKFWLRSLAFSDQNHGWIVGSRGTIIQTTDGGGNWKIISGITIAEE